MRRYVDAMHDYEECVADRDWAGADYAIEVVDFMFSRMEAEVGKSGFVKPASPPPQRPSEEADSLMAALDAEMLCQILDSVMDACERDGFGAVYQSHNGDLTDALSAYESYKKYRNKE
jgi:hypothetical protein